jgi:16S rRNA (cytidine1402-2'-O)-methyltransferase
VGTLYVIGAPAGDPEDLTLRARRLLEEVVVIAADSLDQAQRLLARYDIATPLIALPEGDRLFDILATDDVGLLVEGGAPCSSGIASELIRATIQRGFPVVPIPGPAFPITALVVSGLPADSFVYLDRIPAEPTARRDLLALVTTERRTLVLLESLDHLAGTLTDLRDVLGDRPLVLVTASAHGTEAIWRGTLGQASEPWGTQSISEPCVLVVGGAREQVTRWDGGRLRAEVQARLDQGLGAKEIGRDLAVESGWPRREIYRLAVEMGDTRTGF